MSFDTFNNKERNIDTNSYAPFDDAFVQSETMKDFKDKLISKNQPIPQEDSEADKINNRLDNILKTTKKDKMDKNIDELVSIYGNKNANQTGQVVEPKYAPINRPPPQIPTKPKNNNILATILIIIVILAILYFGYKMFFQNKNHSDLIK